MKPRLAEDENPTKLIVVMVPGPSIVSRKVPYASAATALLSWLNFARKIQADRI